MKLKLTALCSVCCALLYGSVFAENAKSQPSEQKWVKSAKDRIGKIEKAFSAAEKGDLAVIKALSKDPYFSEIMYKRDEDERTVVEVAVRNGHTKVVEFLFDWMETTDFSNQFHVHNTRSHETLLTIAAANGYEDMVRVLLKHHAVIDASIGKTPLMLAAEKGYAGIVELLLTGKDDPDLQWIRHADPNIRDTNNNQTALMLAVRRGHTDIAKLLLDNEADPNKQDSDKVTALMMAAAKGNLNIVKLLLNHGAKVKIKDKKKKTALDYAEGNSKISELLSEHLEKSEKKDHQSVFKRAWNKVTKKKVNEKVDGKKSNLKNQRRMSVDSNATLYVDDTESEFDTNISVDTLVGD